MKRITLLLLTAILFLTQCKKDTCDLEDSTKVATATEIADIKSYLTSNGLTADQHSSGIHYQIQTAGNKDKPNLCSDVSVKYTGMLLNGTVFDQSTSTVTFPLKNLIVGWQLGIPLVGKGGKIKLFIPASLGYGGITQPKIPANSHLIFDIELISFIN